MKEQNIFKEKLYHHTMPVREELWHAIEAQLPPKKEQRIFPLFWLILFASTFLGGALMLGLFNADTSGGEVVHILAGNSSSLPGADLNASASNQTTSAANITGTENSNSNSGDNRLSTMSLDKSLSTGSASYATEIENESVKSGSITSKINTPANSTSLKRKSSNTLSSSKPNPTVIRTANAASLPNQPQLLPSDVLEMQRSRNDYASALLPLTEAGITGTSDLFVIHPVVKPDPNCYKFTGSGGQIVYSIDGFIGPGISPKSFTSNADEGSVYIMAREATESNQYAWSTGARFNIHHRSGLTGRIGFSYTQAGDVFDYTDSLATQSTTRIDSFFAADGTFLYAETSQVLVLGTLIKKIHNTYRYLDIPLIIGYEMPMGRSNLMFNIGPVLNLTSTHEGQILDPMLHPRPITDGEPGAIDVYKTNLGMSLYIGAGVLFPISDALSGLVEPSFTYRFNPVTLNNYPISEHRHYAGLNVGLRYHIQ